MKDKIISPCISICKTDPVTGYCYGCARTNEEKINWKDEKTSDNWKVENLKIILEEVKNSEEINNQHKIILAEFINKTNQLIPLLTNEDLLENETKQKLNYITGKINLLTENFQKPDYPLETEQELNDSSFKDVAIISFANLSAMVNGELSVLYSTPKS